MYKISNYYVNKKRNNQQISNYKKQLLIRYCQMIHNKRKQMIANNQNSKKNINTIVSLNSNVILSSKIKLRSLVSDRNCQYIYAISNCGIYVSNNCGVNWELNNSAPTDLFWTAISCDYSGQNIIASALKSNQIYKTLFYYSNDYGKTWNNTYINDKSEYCISLTVTCNSFIALSSAGNIYESNNCGNTWSHKRQIQYNYNSIVSNYTGQYLFAASLVNNGGIYISNDYGSTWIKEPNLVNCVSIASSNDGQYVAAVCNSKDANGIFISNDFGKTWSKRFVSTTLWSNITSDESGRYLAAASFSNNSDIYLSNDYGLTWTQINTNNNWKFIIYNASGTYLIATTLNVLDENLNINTYNVSH